MYIEQTHSTSSLLRETYSESLPHLYTIRTDFQTAGRGQAGNSWESEKGKNLLFSSLLRYDNLVATEQRRLSMLVSVAICQTLANYISEGNLTIKWPNDVYWNNKKLVGILIENILQSANVAYTIAGIGVNVNQTEWLSNAPNPISLKQITGNDYDIETLLCEILQSLRNWEQCSTSELKKAYMQHLYRKTGWHKFVEREVSTLPTAIAADGIEGAFEAQIKEISSQGELVLQLRTGEDKTYHFKQIRFVI